MAWVYTPPETGIEKNKGEEDILELKDSRRSRILDRREGGKEPTKKREQTYTRKSILESGARQTVM